MKNPIASFFDSRFLSRLVATPRGRAFLLSYMADAEESDEAGVFEALLERVDDPALNKLVKRHMDDEAKHAEMLKARVRATGAGMQRVPAELSVVPRLDDMLGGVGKEFV